MSSPETQSLWQTKPWWCQPWSILLTGLVLPITSWLLFHRVWITAAAAIVVLLWWWVFLVLAPASYQQAAEDPGGERPSG